MESGSILLKKASFESGKISSIKEGLINDNDIEYLKGQSFPEILKFLEENGFSEAVDSSYLNYEGFYLVERVLNEYLSSMYEKFFSTTSKENRGFLELFYFKYQIHNFLAVFRCRMSGENDVEPYLIGEKRRKDKFIKAFSMTDEDAIKYLSKKLNLDGGGVLEFYKKGLFELENYLYKMYYERLVKGMPVFDKRQDKKYEEFIRKLLDLINLRIYCVLNEESVDLFNELFVNGGYISQEEFGKLSRDRLFSKIGKSVGCKIGSNYEVDKVLSFHKRKGGEEFNELPFSSPYRMLGFFLYLESIVGVVRTILKAKYMGMSREEVDNLLKNE